MPDFFRMGLILMVVGLTATAILAGTDSITKGPIAEAKRQELLHALQQVLPPGFDNSPDQDFIVVNDARLDKKSSPVKIYRARGKGADLGAAFTVIAPNGYSGDIEILLGMAAGGTVSSIRILSHKETPGLGDKFATTSWPDAFKGKTASNVKWGVKKDGGDFDQFAGATITPRAIVGAVKRGLDFFVENEAKLFAKAAPAATKAMEVRP
ncbi:MAG: RnfABCDGE type electron transport complex subunit G [Magnetococcales bacterium]|nr:RnfABCDGE type electron transport complex subunit G [Magnetococcales bacterium]MBF0322388.1 RnfABCDGE type electron transport complex subunit G [Magnetococcales bacterium]